MTKGVQRFTDLRAWQACDTFKRAILCEQDPIAHDFGRRRQIEEAAARTTAHIAEGFGRFYPADFARFCGIARASLMESQNHLIDFVHKKYISEQRREALNKPAETALEEVSGLMEYLQSPEALRNARRARERRMANRGERRTKNLKENTEPKPKTNSEP
jgi:four helix bundle protein